MEKEKKVEVKTSGRERKYIIAQVVIAVFMIVVLIMSKIMEFESSMTMYILTGCTLVSFVILNIMVIASSEKK